MGTYVNPEIDNFRSSINYKFYVDKSMLIALLNEKLEGVDRFLCVSRPRRFGKTMAANMIAAYYSKGRDSHELFSNLKVSKDPSYEDNINKYTVLKLDLNGAATKKGNLTIVQYLKKKVVPELIEAYPNIGLSEDDQLPELLVNIHKVTGDKFVFIIDEYDLPIREEKYSAEFEEYIDFLISLFKSEDTNYTIALAYLTGIIPIIKEKTQSKLNNFIEYTMIDPDEMAPFMGFIEDEVKDLSSKVGMDFEEQKRWYDGYNLDGLDVYSPKSVISSVTKKRCDDYWVETSS
ncbi:MAG: AAA family ATPase, partial [Candidatus Ornithospirochaeta sp.]